MPIIIAAKYSYWRNHDFSKIHIWAPFYSSWYGWRPLAHVCLWLHLSSCLYTTRRRYIVSINMASVKAYSIAYQFQVFGSFYFLIDLVKRNCNCWGFYNFSRSFLWTQLVTMWYCPFNRLNFDSAIIYIYKKAWPWPNWLTDWFIIAQHKPLNLETWNLARIFHWWLIDWFFKISLRSI